MKRPETVTCQHCGKDVPGKHALGVGPVDRAIWTCSGCITKHGALDAVFGPRLVMRSRPPWCSGRERRDR